MALADMFQHNGCQHFSMAHGFGIVPAL